MSNSLFDKKEFAVIINPNGPIVGFWSLRTRFLHELQKKASTDKYFSHDNTATITKLDLTMALITASKADGSWQEMVLGYIESAEIMKSLLGFWKLDLDVSINVPSPEEVTL